MVGRVDVERGSVVSPGGFFGRLALRLSPDRLLLLLAVLVFIAELCDMLLISLLPEMSTWAEALVDSFILLILLSPAYFLFYRPFWKERQRAEKNIRRLSRQLIRTEENTRKALSRDLHDEFGQILSSLQFGIETLKNSFPKDEEKLAAQCTRLSNMTAQLGSHVRDICTELRPAMLDILGLAPTLHWYVRKFRQQHPEIEIEDDIDDVDGNLPLDVVIALFRVCQESLNNIAKHASAARVRVHLKLQAELLTLELEDDGVGFEPMQRRRVGDENGGLGLLGMKERVADIGGLLTISSQPGSGTVIRAEVPTHQGEK